MGASWGLLGPSWGPLQPSWEPLEPLPGAYYSESLEISIRGLPLGLLWGHSWGCLGALLGRLGRLLGRLGAVLSHLRALLGASWVVLGWSWGSLEPSRSIRQPQKREPKHLSKTNVNLTILAFRDALGRPLGSLLGHLRDLLDRLGAILGVLERSLGVLGAWWKAPRRSPCHFGSMQPPRTSREKSQKRHKRPEAPENTRESVSPPPSQLESKLHQQHSCVNNTVVSLGALHFVPEARWRALAA